MKIFLSIIIPAYNEEKNIKRGVIEAIADYLKNVDYQYEILFIDDGSTDKTSSLLKKKIGKRGNWHLLKRPHLGKAEAIKYGIEKSKGENILFTDFDQATPLGEIEKLLPFLKKNYQIIIGSREIKGAERKKEPFYRHLMGKIFNFIVRLIALKGIMDSQCGFKLFKAKEAKELFHQLKIKHAETKRAFTGAFDVEVLFLAQKKGYKIAEVPVYWRHYQTDRVNPFKDSFRMFFDVLKIKFNDLLGRYNE